MKLTYTVHSFNKAPVMVEMTYMGKNVQAPIDGIDVEMVSPDGSHTYTVRTVPDDMEEAEAIFKVGNTVNVDITAA